MSRDQRLELIDGDICRDPHGNIGSARKSFNRTRREYFVGVFIVEGPEQGSWAKRKWEFTPEINYEGGTLDAICARCHRPFLSRSRVLGDLGGYTVARDSRCRTCLGLQTQEPAGYVGSEEQKVEHHAK